MYLVPRTYCEVEASYGGDPPLADVERPATAAVANNENGYVSLESSLPTKSSLSSRSTGPKRKKPRG